MSDQPNGPIPDPTSATTEADLRARLDRLRAWAGAPSAKELRALGDTGSIETHVAACLRARYWSPADIDREVARWQAAARRVTPAPSADDSPSAPSADDAALHAATVVLPIVPPDEATSAPAEVSPTAEPTSPPASAGLSWAPVSSPPRARGRWNTGLSLAAALTVALVLIALPALVLGAGDRPAPLAAPPATPSPFASPPAASADPAPEPGSPPAPESPSGNRARAAQPSSSRSPAPPAPPERVTRTRPRPPTSSTAPSSKPPPPPPGPWSAIVDNTTSGRFSASGNWATGSGSGQQYGGSFRYAGPDTEQSDAAWYKFDLPETGEYRVEAWFPADSDYNDRTPFVIVTTSGNQTVHRSQRTNGGRWVSLGTFTLAAGDRYVVGVSRWASGSSDVVADAIRITEV